jgi:halogenation protein CepH
LVPGGPIARSLTTARASRPRRAASPERFDAIVIGGGPAGSTAAGFLARAGARVALFEKDRFPRYHIGESLLSATLPILEELGALPAIAGAGFVRKPGGTFLWGRSERPWSFFFREDPGGRPHAFHVVRSQFDEILLRHAAALGAEVREQRIVREVAYDPLRRSAEVRFADAGGERSAHTSFVIDASGQSALLGRRDRLRQFDPFFKNLAVFAYFEDAEALCGEAAGNILSVAFPDGWFWFIPLHDGTTSVGAVVDARRFAAQAAGAPDDLYRRLIAACAPLAARLRRARLASPVRVIRDYSYCSRRFYGPGYLLAGDAACFIDPVFSTGVHLACLSGYLAARALGSLLGANGSLPDAAAALRDYDERYRAAYERYLSFLTFFYDHHADPDSYFWQARKILAAPESMRARTSFVRLVSGGADLEPDARRIAREIDLRHDRMASATRRARFGAIPEAGIFRVRSTLAAMAPRRDGEGEE